uniref:Uncharacterized protein n=1 Tax=Ficus carica TaxID=3494 RepID=A0AA88EHE2_FICCA|nr:hypothetical protein TIFTF001_053241 [Ficus carica]
MVKSCTSTSLKESSSSNNSKCSSLGVSSLMRQSSMLIIGTFIVGTDALNSLKFSTIVAVLLMVAHYSSRIPSSTQDFDPSSPYGKQIRIEIRKMSTYLDIGC